MGNESWVVGIYAPTRGYDQFHDMHLAVLPDFADDCEPVCLISPVHLINADDLRRAALICSVPKLCRAMGDVVLIIEKYANSPDFSTRLQAWLPDALATLQETHFQE